MPAVATVLDDRIRRHHADLVAWLTRRVPDGAEELAQEVWLRVARAAPDCADDAAFRGYAFVVARRLVIDAARRRAARVVLVSLAGGAPEPRDDGARPDADLASAELLAVVERTLAGLKPEVADVFRWRTTRELSFAEIAARQGVPLNTALGRMHQAVTRLRDALRDADLLGGSR